MLDTRLAHFLLIAILTFGEEYYINFKSSHGEFSPPSCYFLPLMSNYYPDGFVLKNLVPALPSRVQL